MSSERFEALRREVEACDASGLFLPSDLLLLPAAVQVVLRQAFRDGRITVVALAAGLALEADEGQALAELLVAKGFLHPDPSGAAATYVARFGGRPRSGGTSPLDRL